MSEIQVEIIQNRIPGLVVRVEADARSAVKQTADDIRDRMKDLAPKDTGEMAGSISSDSNIAGKEASVSIGVDYWIFPNYGTRHQVAQPFVEPAIVGQEAGLLQRIISAFVGFF